MKYGLHGEGGDENLSTRTDVLTCLARSYWGFNLSEMCNLGRVKHISWREDMVTKGGALYAGAPTKKWQTKRGGGGIRHPLPTICGVGSWGERGHRSKKDVQRRRSGLLQNHVAKDKRRGRVKKWKAECPKNNIGGVVKSLVTLGGVKVTKKRTVKRGSTGEELTWGGRTIGLTLDGRAGKRSGGGWDHKKTLLVDGSTTSKSKLTLRPEEVLLSQGKQEKKHLQTMGHRTWSSPPRWSSRLGDLLKWRTIEKRMRRGAGMQPEAPRNADFSGCPRKRRIRNGQKRGTKPAKRGGSKTVGFSADGRIEAGEFRRSQGRGAPLTR